MVERNLLGEGQLKDIDFELRRQEILRRQTEAALQKKDWQEIEAKAAKHKLKPEV